MVFEGLIDLSPYPSDILTQLSVNLIRWASSKRNVLAYAFRVHLQLHWNEVMGLDGLKMFLVWVSCQTVKVYSVGHFTDMCLRCR